MKKLVPYLTLISLSIFFSCSNNSEVEQLEEPTAPPLFKLINSADSGINFQNTLNESLNLNVLMYEYLYNGGGVAVGDLNGDGFEDIYFSANVSGNQLYLNKGGFKFQEISKISGTEGRPGPWKTGVTFVDINGDKQLDIYLCYSGNLRPDKRKNQLFVNQGNDENGIPIFKEMAEEYGIASGSPSTSASFFDFDRDGDLDLFLLNHNTKSTQILDISVTKTALKQKHEAGPQLFENQNGKFLEITEKAGISSSSLSYGLGLAISDINRDGWPDIYIGNDYTIPDYLYINQKDGTFKDQILEMMDHVSNFSMGNDIADINNDGLVDVMTLDMMPEENTRQKLLLAPDNYEVFDLNVRKGFHHQYMRNMLHVNNGDGTFYEIGQVAGISNTDWSWASLFADFDNDGWKDLFVSNGYLRDYNNMDFLKYMDNYVQTSGGKLKREDLLNMVKNMPSSNLTNYIYRNNRNLTFENVTQEWGLNQPANSNGVAYADLDNDGDLDLIVNNINSKAFVYQNLSVEKDQTNYLQVKLVGDDQNSLALGASVKLYSQGKTQFLEQNIHRGFQSSVSPILHFGLGNVSKVDYLVVTWPDGRESTEINVQANQQLVLNQSESGKSSNSSTSTPASIFKASNTFEIPQGKQINDFKRQPLLTNQISGNGKAFVAQDFNGDGLEDLFVGGGVGISARLYFQSQSGSFNKVDSSAFVTARDSEDSDAIAFDANGDGFLDLYVSSGGVFDFTESDSRLADRLYLNDGKGKFTLSPNALPDDNFATGTVVAFDFNQDQALDLFVGGRVVPGQYPLSPGSKLLINDGSGMFSNQTSGMAPEFMELGMVTDAEVADLDQDGFIELVVVGEAMPIKVFGIQSATISDKTSDFFDQQEVGFWNNLTIDDFNGDGQMDIFAGNLGLNSQLKVSDQEPAELLYKDFDGNGSIDALLSSYIGSERYPTISRDELLGQVNFLKKRYLDFKSFASVKTDDIFTVQEREGAKQIYINRLKSTLFVRSSSGKFVENQLPIQVQFSPVFTSTFADINGDGNKDLIIAGNMNQTKLRYGKYDANHAMVFLGNGKGDFTYLDKIVSGISEKGDIRNSQIFDHKLLFLVKDKGIVSYSFLSSKD
ncbi:VCBS repeat-containing protein [Algoriphagus halophilus]|uniref:Repeat domain-containing protein n=1 Tax=Algoriphagus halophilus TaxID=226505 RepID=A0A1N6FX92_9BACT|nr:VCBS repeat-containing protein [Algoriphagus halophilus]SIN99888.1 Repeat domain-containing protein [Algoriphagus halophilus]